MHVGKEEDDWVIEEEDWLDVVCVHLVYVAAEVPYAPKKETAFGLIPDSFFPFTSSRGAHNFYL